MVPNVNFPFSKGWRGYAFCHPQHRNHLSNINDSNMSTLHMALTQNPPHHEDLRACGLFQWSVQPIPTSGILQVISIQSFQSILRACRHANSIALTYCMPRVWVISCPHFHFTAVIKAKSRPSTKNMCNNCTTRQGHVGGRNCQFLFGAIAIPLSLFLCHLDFIRVPLNTEKKSSKDFESRQSLHF